MFHFDPQAYGPLLSPLLEPEPLCELGPGRPDESKRKLLARLDARQLHPSSPVRNAEMARCCLAGLWLLHDFLEESHVLSQEIESPTGSYWHGIMHRREPDFSNAKYWFRRVGKHETDAGLQDDARTLAESKREAKELPAPASYLLDAPAWDSAHFVDLCQEARESERLTEFCRLLAQAQWRRLFDFCYRRSIE